MSPVPSKRRTRASEACDECRRKKTKCNWRPPRCADCLRLDSDCTFSGTTRVAAVVEAPSATKPVNGTMSLPARSDSLNISLPTTSSPQTAESFTPVSAASLIRSGMFVTFLARYLTLINHYMPIFIPERLRTVLLNDESRLMVDQPFNLACASGIVASVATLPQTSQDLGNERALELAVEATNLATSEIKILQQTSSLFVMQTLLTVVVSLQHSPSLSETTTNLIAVAARMAFSVKLHRLNEISNMDITDRLERIQVWWCLVILDMETCLRHNTPPCIAADEIDPLYIEPPRFPQMGYGIVSSTDGMALSLVSAKQRLLSIASRMWNSLYTTKALLQPKPARAAIVSDLNDRLSKWRDEWFASEYKVQLSERWPSGAVPRIVELQFTYFEVILKCNPHLVTNPVEIDNAQESGRTLLAPSSDCLEAARDTLRLAPFRGVNTRESIDAGLRYTVPAVVLLLAHGVPGSNVEHIFTDISLVHFGLTAFRQFLTLHENEELRMTVNACQAIIDRMKMG